MGWVWDIIEAYRDSSLIPRSVNVADILLTQEQIEAIIDNKLIQFKENELSKLKREYLSLSASNIDTHSIILI